MLVSRAVGEVGAICTGQFQVRLTTQFADVSAVAILWGQLHNIVVDLI
jgi:hypothetical protein